MDGLVSRSVSKTEMLKETKGLNLKIPHAHRLATLIPRPTDSPDFAAQFLLLRKAQVSGMIRRFPGF